MSDLRGSDVPHEAGPLADPVAFDVLSSLLWTERELLENLLFRLVTEQLILASGRTRWLLAADADVVAAVERLREHEIARSIETDGLAGRYELAPDATLRMLARLAPEPWPQLLSDQRDVLNALNSEIDSAAAENRDLLQEYERANRLASHAGVSAPRPSAVSRLHSSRERTDRRRWYL